MPGLAIGKISELFELVHASLLSSAEWKTLERGCLSSQVWRGEGNFMQCGSHIMRKRGRSNEPDSGVDVTSLAGPAYDRELDVALMLGRSHGSPRYP